MSRKILTRAFGALLAGLALAGSITPAGARTLTPAGHTEAGLSWDATLAAAVTPASTPVMPHFTGPIAQGYGITLWMIADTPIKGYYGGWVWYVGANATPYTGSGPNALSLNIANTPPNGVVVTNQMWFTPLGGQARLIASETVSNGYQSNGWYPFSAQSKYGVLEVGPGYYTHAFSAAVNNHGPAGPGSLGWGKWVDQTFYVNT